MRFNMGYLPDFGSGQKLLDLGYKRPGINGLLDQAVRR
jgi:hypothetical protein